jgi:hypothetical protein
VKGNLDRVCIYNFERVCIIVLIRFAFKTAGRKLLIFFLFLFTVPYPGVNLHYVEFFLIKTESELY